MYYCSTWVTVLTPEHCTGVHHCWVTTTTASHASPRFYLPFMWPALHPLPSSIHACCLQGLHLFDLLLQYLLLGPRNYVSGHRVWEDTLLLLWISWSFRLLALYLHQLLFCPKILTVPLKAVKWCSGKTREILICWSELDTMILVGSFPGYSMILCSHLTIF